MSLGWHCGPPEGLSHHVGMRYGTTLFDFEVDGAPLDRNERIDGIARRMKGWSARTPIRITVPMTAKLSELGMPRMFTRFCRTWSRAVPRTMPMIEPSPPARVDEPRSAAAMA